MKLWHRNGSRQGSPVNGASAVTGRKEPKLFFITLFAFLIFLLAPHAHAVKCNLNGIQLAAGTGSLFERISPGLAPLKVSLNTRLNGCPVLRDQIVWEEPDGKRIAYRNWSAARKIRLNQIFQKLQANSADLGLKCPDPVANMNKLSTTVYLSSEEAFDVYAAHVAHALLLEINGTVPWKIHNLPPAQLEELLASYRYHSVIKPSADTSYPNHIKAGRDYQPAFHAKKGSATLCDPRVGINFITGRTSTGQKNLLGATMEGTLSKLTSWLTDNVGHGPFGGSRSEIATHALLSDRLKPDTQYGLILAYSGCHGASNILYDLARSVNIPLLNVAVQENNNQSGHFGNRTHRGLIFQWTGHDARMLWHLDEIYATPYREPTYPINSRGRRLGTTAAVNRYYSVFWPRVTDLQKWGFQYNLKTVYPEQGFGVNSRGSYEDYNNYGEMAGYWLRSRREQAIANQGVNDLSNPYILDFSETMRLEQEYQLCSWNLVKHFCENTRQSLIDRVIDRQKAKHRMVNLPVTRLTDDYWKRAAACVRAYRGCSAVQSHGTLWLSTRGANVGH